MKKETIAAILFGIVFGSVLGLFLIVKNKQTQREKTKAIVPTGVQNQQPVNMIRNAQVLELQQPMDRAIVYQNSIKIQGKAVKNSLIMIQSPIKDSIQKNQEEQFSVDFPLALGENVIRISVYPKDVQLQVQEKELRVYYFTEKL